MHNSKAIDFRRSAMDHLVTVVATAMTAVVLSALMAIFGYLLF